MSVPQILFRRLPFVRRVNVALGKLLVKRAETARICARCRGSRSHPGFLANAFDEAAVVYYCIDDYAALPDVDARAVAEMDAHLTSRADQVFVASSRMLQAKRRSPRPRSLRMEWTLRSSDGIGSAASDRTGARNSGGRSSDSTD